MSEPLTDYPNLLEGAASELVSAQSALNSPPDPIEGQHLSGAYLTDRDKMAEHAYRHICAALELVRKEQTKRKAAAPNPAGRDQRNFKLEPADAEWRRDLIHLRDRLQAPIEPGKRDSIVIGRALNYILDLEMRVERLEEAGRAAVRMGELFQTEVTNQFRYELGVGKRP